MSAAAAPAFSALFRLAWPIVIARSTQAVVGFSDALMVAPLGEATLAAVTTGALNLFCMVMLPMGTTFILQSFASQLHGLGDLVAARRYALHGLAFACVTAVITLATIPFIPALLRPLGYEAAVATPMAAYLEIRSYSVLAVVGSEALGNWFAGLGRPQLSLVAGVTTMALNLAGNYLLIEPRFGLPGYGAAGAALASTVASWGGFGVLLFRFARETGAEAPAPSLARRWSEFVRFLRFGLPSGFNWFLEFAAFLLFINFVVGHLGTTTLAAFNVMLQLNSLSFMPAFGFASAGAILVGEAIGRGNRDAVAPILRRTLTVTIGWMASVGVLYLLIPGRLLSLFEPPGGGPDLLAIGATMLALSGVWQLFDAIGITLGEGLRAAGDTFWPMVARLLLAWLFFAPVGWATVFLWNGGVVSVMLVLILYIVLIAVALSLRFASGAWRHIELVEAELPLLPGSDLAATPAPSLPTA